MKLFIINLKRRVEKRKRVIEMLEKYPFLDYEIFEAIDGEEIDNEYMVENGFQPYQNWYDPNMRRGLTKGEIGCSLSHWHLWKKIGESNLKTAIIIEDDALFTNISPEKVNEIEKYLESSELLYLGRKVFNTNEEPIDEFVSKPNFSYWTIGYAISNKGANSLSKSGFERALIPVDEFLPYTYSKNNCKQLGRYPVQTRIIAYAYKNEILKPINNSFEESDTEKSEVFISIQNSEDDERKLVVLSVATHETDGLERFIRSGNQFGIGGHILGLEYNKKYDMLHYPGGGFKVNLLKKKLIEMKNIFKKDDLILFTDSFDVVINDNAQNIIEKYKKFNGKIVFSAETYCWPDKLLAIKYPMVEGRFKYLNSGGFIGSYQDLCNLLELEKEESILDTDDDQRYYTHKFLSNEYPIVLDHNCEIFQTINGATDIITINFGKGTIQNDETKTTPAIIHGNGGMDSKIFFNTISNYLYNQWLDAYGYGGYIKKEIKKIPNVLLVFDGPEYLHNYENIDYHEDNLTILTFANLQNGHYFCVNNCEKVMVFPDKGIKENRIQAIKFGKKLGMEYIFFIDKEHKINNSNCLMNLLKDSKKIIAPMLVKPNSVFSNFWGAIDSQGFYSRSFDYFDIVNRKRRGVWNVPYINNTYLISERIFDVMLEAFNYQDNTDFDMSVCKYLRENNIFMYVENLENHGFIALKEEDEKSI